MAYKEVWWCDNVEYGAGLNRPKTFQNIYEQYRRPKMRYYDPPLPTETYSKNMLYYEKPRLGKPTYRAVFRDKPFIVTDNFPRGAHEKTRGFHGRLYYEHSPPTFKYQGPPKDTLYWLEKPQFLPVFPRPNSSVNAAEANRGLNMPSSLGLRSSPVGLRGSVQKQFDRETLSIPSMLSGYTSSNRLSDRVTQDSSGYL